MESSIVNFETTCTWSPSARRHHNEWPIFEHARNHQMGTSTSPAGATNRQPSHHGRGNRFSITSPTFFTVRGTRPHHPPQSTLSRRHRTFGPVYTSITSSPIILAGGGCTFFLEHGFQRLGPAHLHHRLHRPAPTTLRFRTSGGREGWRYPVPHPHSTRRNLSSTAIRARRPAARQ